MDTSNPSQHKWWWNRSTSNTTTSYAWPHIRRKRGVVLFAMFAQEKPLPTIYGDTYGRCLAIYSCKRERFSLVERRWEGDAGKRREKEVENMGRWVKECNPPCKRSFASSLDLPPVIRVYILPLEQIFPENIPYWYQMPSRPYHLFTRPHVDVYLRPVKRGNRKWMEKRGQRKKRPCVIAGRD